MTVEFAGQLAEAGKSFMVVSGSKRLLPISRERASERTLKKLMKLGVEVLLGTTVLRTKDSVDGDGNTDSVAVELDTGDVLEADLYIPPRA